MRKVVYPAKYIDDFGVEETDIGNDGKDLTIQIRGVQFEGFSFDDFEPVKNTPNDLLKDFTLYEGRELCNCQLECDIPINLIINLIKG